MQPTLNVVWMARRRNITLYHFIKHDCFTNISDISFYDGLHRRYDTGHQTKKMNVITITLSFPNPPSFITSSLVMITPVLAWLASWNRYAILHLMTNTRALVSGISALSSSIYLKHYGKGYKSTVFRTIYKWNGKYIHMDLMKRSCIYVYLISLCRYGNNDTHA